MRRAHHLIPGVLAALAGGLLAIGAAPAFAAPPVCDAALFAPTEGADYVVEQPDSAPGAVFCESDRPLAFALGTSPAHGLVSALVPNGTGGASFSYTPALGYVGPDGFVVQVSDGESPAVAVPLSVRVRAAANEAPTCFAELVAPQADGAYRVEAAEPVAGHLECFDDEGDSLSFAIADAPGHGAVSTVTTSGDFVYTPGSAVGDDAFALVASDGALSSVPAVVEVTIVEAHDDAPQCTAVLATTSGVGGAFEVEQGTSVSATVLCDDPEGHALTFGIGVAPAHGVLAPLLAIGEQAAETAYTPAPGYLGLDLFRVDVSDGSASPSPLTVRVRVVPARDDAPTCTADIQAPLVAGHYRVEQGHTIHGALRCADESAVLTHSVATAPQHGSVSAIDADGRFTYTASGAFAGRDAFALTASDGVRDSVPVTLAIQITPAVNDPPVCQIALSAGADDDGAFLVDRGRETRGRIVCDDDEGADLTFSLDAGPAHGVLSGLADESEASAGFAYRSAAGYAGPDAFTLTASDGVTGPQATVVAIEVVEPSARAPQCSGRLHTPIKPGGFEVESGEAVPGTLSCFDADGDALTFQVPIAPSRGAISGLENTGGTSARFTYTAGATTGVDRVQLVATDGTHGSNLVIFDIVVITSYDAPPVCAASLFTTPLATAAYPAQNARPNDGIVSCVDDEGGPLTFGVTADPRHGHVADLSPEGEFATFRYVADSSYVGSDAMTLRARDASGGEDVMTVAVDVRPSTNTPPACTGTLAATLQSNAYDLAAGQSVSGEIVCEDAESDAITVSVERRPALGTLTALTVTGTRRSFTFTAPSGSSGNDSFVLRAVDALGAARDVTIAVRIAAAPVTGNPEAGAPGSGGTGTPSTPGTGPPAAGIPGPGGGGSAGPGGGTPVIPGRAGAGQLQPATVSGLRLSATKKRDGVRLSFKAVAGQTISVILRIRIRGKATTVGRATKRFARAGKQNLDVKLNSRGKLVLKRQRKIAISVALTVGAPGKRSAKISKRVTLKTAR